MEPIIDGLPEFFQPLRLLGEGGMGVVWSVLDKRVNKIGALKVIRKKADVTPVTYVRFDREIRNFARLVHPYIVQVYDVGHLETGEPYIFMEQVEGAPINSDALKGLPFSEIMALIDRILEGLDEAHAHGLIHRDLKPDNILVTRDAEGRLMPKLMDFGLALFTNETDSRITSNGMVVGTPVYMAPEQACDEHYQICPATDFYSIGCILYELFTGAPPFNGKTPLIVMLAQAKDKPKPFRPLPEFAETAKLTPIIDILLDKEPDQRYETAADFRSALRKAHLIQDDLVFGSKALRDEQDTVFDARDDNVPFFTSDLSHQTYNSVIPDLEHSSYNYSVLSLRPPMFVGRSTAKHLLHLYLKDVYKCRHAALTLVTGRPGVGKTRLLDDFAKDCYHQGIASNFVIDGSACENFIFAIFQALFAKLLLKTLTPQQIDLALCRFLGTDDEEDTRVIALKNIYQAEINHTAPPTELMEQSLATVFSRLTQRRPLLIILDNMTPSQNREVMRFAQDFSSRSSLQLPVLICIINTALSDIPTDTELALGNLSSIWLRRSISLDPLSNHDMHELVTHSLGIGEQLSGFIENMSSGLPQIAVNLARQWQLGGFLNPTEDGYISRVPQNELPIPRTVHEAILRQINLVFANYPLKSWSPVAAIAALFGESFTPALFSAALAHTPADSGLISHSAFISLALSGSVLKTLDENTLAFCNPLMRDALLATRQPYEIQDYHYAIAQAWQELPESPENNQKIAQHLENAHRYYESHLMHRKLARQNILAGNLDAAADCLEHARENLKQHLGFVDANSPGIAEIWILETEIALELGDLDKAKQRIQWLDYSSEITENSETGTRILVLKSRLFTLMGQFVQARQVLDQALEITKNWPEPISHDLLEIRFAILASLVRFDDAFDSEFIETARALNDVLYVSRAFLAIASKCLDDRNFERATRILNLAIDTAHRNGDLHTEAHALYMLARTQNDQSEMRLKTLYDALRCFEKLADFRELAKIHKELAAILSPNAPDEARIHAHWSELIA